MKDIFFYLKCAFKPNIHVQASSRVLIDIGLDPIETFPALHNVREACLHSPTDPGYHSATPSVACDEEIFEIHRDFRVS